MDRIWNGFRDVLLVRGGWLTLFVLLLSAPITFAQSSDSSSYQISAGFSYLSNSVNGVPGARQPLAGWEASLASSAWRNLRFKIDYSGYESGRAPAAILHRRWRAVRLSSWQGKAVCRGALRRLRTEWKLGPQTIAGKFSLLCYIARRRRRYSGVQAPGDALRGRL